jgi:hypothetical protein
MIPKVAADIFASLRKMDTGAKPVTPPWPTGLRDYAVFRKGSYSVKGSSARENGISDRLMEILELKNYKCVPRPRYSNSSKFCDIIMNVPGSAARCWIEVKGLWRHKFNEVDLDGSVRRGEINTFSKHLKAAADDIDKLIREVTKSDASYVGMLLIAFGSEHFPILDDHVQIISSRAVGWQEFRDEWPDSAWKFGHIRCHFWCRSL